MSTGQPAPWTILAIPAIPAILAGGCVDERDPCQYEVCDIQNGACVRRVAEAVACQRESPLVVPRVLFATAQEVVGTVTEPSAEELQDHNDYWAGEALVGLMPEGYDASNALADSISNVLAFYSRQTKEVVIITDAMAPDVEASYSTLIHEMMHVYQDAEYDLTALWDERATTADRDLAMRAVVEGEATWYQILADFNLEGKPISTVDWAEYFSSFQAAMLERAQLSNTPSLDARGLFPYAFGGDITREAWFEGGPESVLELAADPADSVLQVMAGYGNRGPQRFNRDDELRARAVPVLAGHTLLGSEYQSVWLVNAMLQRTAGSREPWPTVLSGIGADHLSVFRNDATREAVAVWRIVEDEPGELRSAMRAGLMTVWTTAPSSPTNAPQTHWITAVDGDCVLIATAGSDAVAVAATITAWESPQMAAQRAGLDNRRPPELWVDHTPKTMAR